MSKTKMLIGLVSLALSNLSFAAARAEINKESNGVFKIKFCDTALGPQAYVGFQLGQNGIIQKDILKADSCTTKTYGQGQAAEGNNYLSTKCRNVQMTWILRDCCSKPLCVTKEETRDQTIAADLRKSHSTTFASKLKL